MRTYIPKVKPQAAAVEKASTRKKNKSWIMKLVSWLHLWPSLISGIIIIFVCLTGTIIVYCDEIMDFTTGDAKYVPQVKDKRITFQAVEAVLHKHNPNFTPTEYVFFKDPERSLRVRAFDTVAETLLHIYIDQYTGSVLKEDRTIHFFYVTAHLHAQLLAGKTGGWIVTLSTIIFLISTITGLVLWWPAKWTKRSKQASFTVKWKAKFKRLNYDLHNVYGFYSLILCLLLSVTGLLLFFHPLGDAVNKLFGGGDKHIAEQLPPPAKDTRSTIDLVNRAYHLFEHEAKDKINVSIWAYNLDQSGAYLFSLGKSGLKSTENLDIVAFDKYTGAKIPIHKQNIRHDKVDNYIWQFHMGQWWGQIGKFSTFLAGIIATSLTITGFLIWWGRRKKKKIA